MHDRSEYDSAADWCAARGYHGKVGDPLPDLLSAPVHQLIDDDPEAFERRVRECAFRRWIDNYHREAKRCRG